ncbi:MAG: hypothetical protein CM1200mP2_09310 [Planctomycetaceae bacterium]|nr:MAG: hypothetical protein CM1200mP2_09310 [Planctomycetaceae bacterium]
MIHRQPAMSPSIRSFRRLMTGIARFVRGRWPKKVRRKLSAEDWKLGVGEAVLTVLQREGGDGLAGVVVMTDGASNAGTDPGPARQLAVRRKVRLFAVGVGSLELPDNIQLVNVQAPTDVHVGDAYGFSVFVKGQGAGVLGKDVQIELLRKPESGEGDPDEKVDTQTVRLPPDAGPVEVKFELNPDTAGRFEFLVRAVSPSGITELSDDDNHRRRLVNVTERKLKVLLLAGGPMRDYRFVRNMLFRHPGVEVDVLLQTADPGDAISQDADRVLQEFPAARDELFAYDVIVGFDPDWQAIPDTRREMLVEWIEKQAGGLLAVAGDVFTPELADAAIPLDDIRTLYPVILEPLPLETNLTRNADQAWPVEFSDDGLDAAFSCTFPTTPPTRWRPGVNSAESFAASPRLVPRTGHWCLPASRIPAVIDLC